MVLHIAQLTFLFYLIFQRFGLGYLSYCVIVERVVCMCVTNFITTCTCLTEIKILIMDAYSYYISQFLITLITNKLERDFKISKQHLISQREN